MTQQNFVYTPLSSAEIKNEILKIHKLWNNYLKVVIPPHLNKFSVNLVSLAKTVEMVHKNKVHYDVFHSGMEISEFKETALYCYWLTKLKPFSILDENTSTPKDYYYASKVNEMFGVYLILSIIKYKKHKNGEIFCMNPKYIDCLMYSLMYRDISKEALSIIVDSYYYHKLVP